MKKRKKSDKQEFTCPECNQTWEYGEMDFRFAESDNCCHECIAGVEDYPANEGG